MKYNELLYPYFMKRFYLLISIVCLAATTYAQTKPELTVQSIMRDAKTWIGTSPSGVNWSEDSKTIYFNWNPEVNPGDSLYKVAVTGGQPMKVSVGERQQLPAFNGEYDANRSKKVFAKNGDLYLLDLKTNKQIQLTNTVGNESSASFFKDANQIIFTADNNLFLLNLTTHQLTQLTDIRNGSDRKTKKPSEQDAWLNQDELDLIQVVRERKEKADASRSYREATAAKRPKTFYLDGRQAYGFQLSADQRYITFVVRKNADAKNTDVPNYVTESSYTENLNARPKVGSAQADQWLAIYNIQKDTIYMAKTDDLPGLDREPEYKQDYPNAKKSKRDVLAYNAMWSDNGRYVITTFRSKDNKDRWIVLLNPETGTVDILSHQHDEAWIAGPGIGYNFSGGAMGWLPDNKHIWFQSEETGYSHLYLVNVETKEKKALTSGTFEVDNVMMSRDKKGWYFNANVDHPGDQQVYYLPLYGGKMTKITTMTGGNEFTLSPDESKVAILHSTTNTPWELYVIDNPITKKSTVPKQLTQSLKSEFKAYPWRKPEVVTFKARDGATVYARLYKPEGNVKNNAAVIFVHGAGYLQNAHLWWSSYYREYMFHNLLADKGYTVLDIDYRGSAGYGRDWRTGIYRHMGGKDLSDHIDGANYLINTHGIDATRLGIYGGSYGGFITLMAMFTEPDVFAAGAALRSVTDWAHYNHPYTANILNTPVEDSIAYRKSSPIYYAAGLKGALLMCHGMIDVNVHFQDIVRLSQRLIELGKENWELAVYPLEDHGFVEPSSWTDEYRRILKLFEDEIGNKE